MTGSYAIYQDGRKISGGIVNGFPAHASQTVRLSARPSVIRFRLTASRTGGHFLLSPAATTVWTWRTRRQPAATLPAGWYCGTVLVGHEYKFQRHCAVQPLLTLSYQVHGLRLDGQAPAGRQLIGLSAGHLQLARAAAITSARAEVSGNDGRTWHRAAVTRGSGAGRFLIAFTAPAGTDVTLRVTAAAAAGGSITETIQNAYRA